MRIYSSILCKKNKSSQANRTQGLQGPNDAVLIKHKQIIPGSKSKFYSVILEQHRKLKRKLKIDQEEEKIDNKEWPGNSNILTLVASLKRDLASDSRLMNSPEFSSFKWSDYIESKLLMQLFMTSYRI